MAQMTLIYHSENKQLAERCNSPWEGELDSRWDPNDFDMIQQRWEFAELPAELEAFSSVMEEALDDHTDDYTDDDEEYDC